MKIDLMNLKKVFDNSTAIDIPEFEVRSGDILGLVGNNGAGKTTLFRLLLDLLEPNDGHVVMTFEKKGSDGSSKTVDIDPSRSEEWKNMTGAYIDDGFLIDFLTPEEYFDFIGKVCGMTKDAIGKRLAEYDHFMSGEILGQKKLIREMSAGNKQKIGIVAALLNNPQLLILDEPFNFLDPSSQNRLKRILDDYNKKTGATILISSHNLQHTIDISSRVVLLEHGVIIKDLRNKDNSAASELESYFMI